MTATTIFCQNAINQNELQVAKGLLSRGAAPPTICAISYNGALLCCERSAGLHALVTASQMKLPIVLRTMSNTNELDSDMASFLTGSYLNQSDRPPSDEIGLAELGLLEIEVEASDA